jgi:hypothetical protein
MEANRYGSWVTTAGGLVSETVERRREAVGRARLRTARSLFRLLLVAHVDRRARVRGIRDLNAAEDSRMAPTRSNALLVEADGVVR